MANNKVIYLKDALKGKTPEEILKMLPFMVCVETTRPRGLCNEMTTEYKSYRALGVTPNALLLDTAIYTYDEDSDGFAPLCYKEDGYISIDLNKLDELNKTTKYDKDYTETVNYIYCSECTPKQKVFLMNYCKYEESDVVSGYEAYHVIANKTKQWEENKKNHYNRSYDPDAYDSLYDDDEGCYFDVPNM